MQTKTIIIAGCAVRVYSIDNGRTWSNRREDLARFSRRYDCERRQLRRIFARIDTSERREVAAY